MNWIIDNGHGIDTKGKRSPDISLLEFDFNRKVASFLFELLCINQYKYIELVPEVEDVSMPERIRRVNKICNEKEGCILVSIHGNGWYKKDEKGNYIKEFNSASGIETYACNQYSPSKPLASLFQKHLLNELGWKNRGVKYRKYYMLRHSNCPSILTENGFYTNKEECELMKKEKTQYLIASAHFKAIQEIESL